MPACASAFFVDTIGPRPISWGFTPPTPIPMIRASGSRPSSMAVSSDISSAADTPSLVGQEFPAVISSGLPPKLWMPLTGGSPASLSIDVSGRMHSSRSKVIVGPVSASTHWPLSSNTGCSPSSGITSSL